MHPCVHPALLPARVRTSPSPWQEQGEQSSVGKGMIGFGVAELKSFFAGFLEDYMVIFERLWGVLKDSGCFSCGFICSELSLQY